jgi:predicted ribosomally synthesized peptide with nif11-like leader
MSVKSFDDLLAAGEKDASLAAALNKARTLSEVVALGAARGFAFSEDEARDGLRKLRSRPLDDSELESVAGGLTSRKAGKGQQEYLKVTMSDILISS